MSAPAPSSGRQILLAFAVGALLALLFPFSSWTRGSLGRADWYHLDNGYESAAAMADDHDRISALAGGLLAQEPGAVLHLGCGNGLLVDRLAHDAPGSIPYGVTAASAGPQHARELCEEHGLNVLPGDPFGAEEAWPTGREYSLVLLDPSELAQAPAEQRAFLLPLLRERAGRILLRVRPGVSLRDSARAAGLAVATADPEARVAVARVP